MQKKDDLKQDPLSQIMTSLREDAGHTGKKSLPPVHLWNPEHCGDINMEIRRDGSWWHEGGRINRVKMVQLFSTILRKDEDGIYLVTPVEKVIVHVEDAPFIATRIEKVDDKGVQTLVVTTNVGDVFVIDREHPIRVVIDADTQEPSPYVEVRDGLEARIARTAFYDLVEWAEEVQHEGATCLGIMSAGERFILGRVE